MSIKKRSETNFLEKKKIGGKVSLYLWVNNIRKLGNILFVIGQRKNEILQLITKEEKLIRLLEKIKRGDLLKIRGIVREKIGETAGEKEIELIKFVLVNSSKLLPFSISDDISITERLKYKYRYLDLRRFNSRKLLLLKSRFLFEVRAFFYKRQFIEIETPILSQYSPEGAHCFHVPLNAISDSNDNNVVSSYFLAQSPQIFKQLLMIAGFEKYYQIAKSFRNEDARSNRQIEFSQLDVEMSFVSMKQICVLVEEFLKTVLPRVFDSNLKISFSTITYRQAIEQYKTEKPDIRKNKEDNTYLSFLWITDWPLFSFDDEEKKYKSLRHPFTTLKKVHEKRFLNGLIKPEEVIGEAFDLICNGEEILSGGMRINKRKLQEKVFETLGYDSQDMNIMFGYFLEALEFAAPPHGGFGLGIDRLLAVILGTKSLKELLAFPKNIDGTCSVTGAPTRFEKCTNTDCECKTKFFF